MSDQEYIKMILALDEEFFKEWKWKEGDHGLIKLDNEYSEFWIGDTELINKLPGYRHEVHTGLNVSTVVGITYDQYTEERLRPLPSQEQLQEIIKNHILKDDETVLDYDIINFFCDWFKAHFCSKTTYKEIEHDFIKAVWLRYAMHIIYSKRWNGESWEKEE